MELSRQNSCGIYRLSHQRTGEFTQTVSDADSYTTQNLWKQRGAPDPLPAAWREHPLHYILPPLVEKYRYVNMEIQTYIYFSQKIIYGKEEWRSQQIYY